jgi:subtilisin family serine protease
MTPLRLARSIACAWLLCGAAVSVAARGLPARAPRPAVARVLIEARPGADLGPLLARAGARVARRLRTLDVWVADLPDGSLAAIEASPAVRRVRPDRPVTATMARTTATIGAAWVRDALGYDGTGVAVAIVDSGVTSWHDDLTGTPRAGAAAGGGQRISRFVDFVNGLTSAYDDFGHGTHVAGIVAGNGYDSNGQRAGVAPGASLVVLKVLDAEGHGRVSDVIAAIDYAIEHRASLGIRVLNLSVAAAVRESYRTDPLTLAARRAVEAGLVVVTSAGNQGTGPGGGAQYGGIAAPGNAPWVITVGASSHRGTPDRADDIVARFSSRGPTAIDYAAKPDLVAPGVGLESLSDPGSTLYLAHPGWRLPGAIPTWYLPYLSLTGSSMAAPVVAGTAALMLQANPALTPNAVKAILEYTAEARPGDDALTEGAGFLNARGAVELAARLAGRADRAVDSPDPTEWSLRIIWGNRRLDGGRIRPDASAWALTVDWGAADARPWSADAGPAPAPPNVVWGAACGGADCAGVVWTGWCDAAGCARPVWENSRPEDRRSGDGVQSSLAPSGPVIWSRR